MSQEVATVIVGVLVFIPAVISAINGWRTRRDLRTNHGKKPGEYIEEGALATFEQGRQIGTLQEQVSAVHEQLNEHMANDVREFAKIHEVLEQQNAAAQEVKTTLEQTLSD